MTNRTEKDLLAGLLQRAFNGAYQTIFLDDPEQREEALIVAKRIEKITVDMGYSISYQIYTTGSRRGQIYRAMVYYNSDRQVLPEQGLISSGSWDEELNSEPTPLLTREDREDLETAFGVISRLLGTVTEKL